MSDYPADITQSAKQAAAEYLKAPERTYDALVKAVCGAIAHERDCREDELCKLREFRRFTMDNTEIWDCPMCRGPRLRAFVCTHCGDDE